MAKYISKVKDNSGRVFYEYPDPDEPGKTILSGWDGKSIKAGKKLRL